MLKVNSFKYLKKNGYIVCDIKNNKELDKIKYKIFKILKKEFINKKINYDSSNINLLFNNFHKLKISDIQLNTIRINLIKELNKDEKIIQNLYKIFSPDLKKILGSDIVGQRKVNLVIHKPKDQAVAPIHRDSPPNSAHEIVLWLPIVNCFKTKSINILKSEFTKSVNKMFLNKKSSYKKIENFFKKNTQAISCNYGQVLLFLTTNFHYIPINKEDETRFSLNFRFKNLFSTYGSKSYPEYFKIVNLTKKSRSLIFKNVKI